MGRDAPVRLSAVDAQVAERTRRIRQFATRKVRDLLGIRVELTDGVILEFGVTFWPNIAARTETPELPRDEQPDPINLQRRRLERRREDVAAENDGDPVNEVNEVNTPPDLANMRYPEWGEVHLVFRDMIEDPDG